MPGGKAERIFLNYAGKIAELSSLPLHRWPASPAAAGVCEAGSGTYLREKTFLSPGFWRLKYFMVQWYNGNS